MNEEILTPEIEILNYFNQITGHRHGQTKDNLSGIKRVLKEGFSQEDIVEVIQVKTLDWKNNPEMSKHLNPVTIFRRSNFDKYINQVIDIKNNPTLYKKHYEQLNKVNKPTDNLSDIAAMYGD